ncbi:chloramphenicol phosphotransferase [Nocardioides guangzhouensis]|uniref:Chloramphenicol phosphotransferase n=1 Tax=Nocardioides guangzhouensis TaxID=2497878 RepID=A0A4Q4Z822_9ACTN|nr:chloramphenicol phosphotransferase [Nocardioides guangzhouensis]
MVPGRIVLLNGTSSSGKSSLARELLRVLPGPWFHLGVDTIGALRSPERTAELDGDELAEVFRRTRAGYHRAVAGLARAGNDVVADHVLSEPWRLSDCLEVWRPFDVVLVGVHCDPDELDRREEERGDRPVGLARSQVRAVHAHRRYDVEVDTARRGVGECAALVAARVAAGPGEAFDALRAEGPW